MSRHYRVGVDVADISGDAGRVDNVVEGQMGDERGLLEQEREGLADTSSCTEYGDLGASLQPSEGERGRTEAVVANVRAAILNILDKNVFSCDLHPGPVQHVDGFGWVVGRFHVPYGVAGANDGEGAFLGTKDRVVEEH
jgi:hypothetical protein